MKLSFKVLLYLLGVVVPLAGCGRGAQTAARSAAKVEPPAAAAAGPCALALAPYSGEGRVDQEIARAQQQARDGGGANAALERVGWLFVSKARLSFDPGYYKLAEQAALCMETKSPADADALLLRGHALHSMHRFGEAEALARALVGERERPFDYGLLGDVLMEQGRLDEAADAYQKMVDLKPDLQSYARAAHMRWLRGDLAGAIELARMAGAAGSPRDAESFAWVYSRLAFYELQAGRLEQSAASSRAALRHSEGYAPALLTLGRVLLAQDKFAEAAEPLRRAAESNPLPEYLWALADALRAGGRADEAREVEARLASQAAATDPRTYALYLATRGEQAEAALGLAARELANRQDVFTLDAHAWALAAAGRKTEARAESKRALAAGTKDARLFYHAGVIAAAAGESAEARRWLKLADGSRHALLPGEREDLARLLATPAGVAPPEHGGRGRAAR